MTPGSLVIRKYANRRLYDTSGSRYINPEDITALDTARSRQVS